MSAVGYIPEPEPQPPYDIDALRLEAVITCVGFDDLLDVTLSFNHSQVDTMIVVTSHKDRATQKVCRKHGTMCVQTDLFRRHGRNFNKGAAINAGMDRFQFFGWRMSLDADCILPDNFRRVLFSHTALDRSCIYGADRIDIVWPGSLRKLREMIAERPQWQHRALIEAQTEDKIGARYTDALRGYAPLGFFQLWHASCQKSYPCSLGTAAHDDIMFATEWPRHCRHLLPTAVCYHLIGRKTQWGENWDGRRNQPRLDGKHLGKRDGKRDGKRRRHDD